MIRGERRHLAALVLALTVPHVLFLALDGRPPNDHDSWYTGGVPDALIHWTLAGGPIARVRVVIDHFLFEGWHPQGAQTVLLAVLGVFGPSLLLFRATNLLFFWLLVVGSYACGRQLRGHRFGLLVAGLIGWLPSMLAYARKWEPMFHGTAVSVVALACAIRCLAPDAARLRWPWVALGLALGARFYTHPTGLPDLAATGALTTLLALLAARKRGEPLTPLARRVALAGGIALALGAWYLGLLPVVDGEPSYRLSAYLRWRQGYLYSDLPALDWHRNVAAVLKLGRGLALWHWQSLLLVVAVPGLVRLPALVRGAPTGPLALLAGVALVQLPVVFVTMKNAGMVVDWLHLEPTFLLVCAASVATLPQARILFGVAVANVAFTALLVPLAGLTTADPVLDDRVWTLRWLDPWTHLETGDVQETPHLPSRGTQAGDVVARAMAAAANPEGQLAVLGVEDLTLTDPAGCGFTSGPRGGDRDAFRSPWPFLFAGFAGFTGVTPAEPVTDPRFVLVRLWHADGAGPLFEGMAHEPELATPVRRCLDAAQTQVVARWPDASVLPIADPPGRLVSRMWAYPTEYAHRAYLVDRRTGLVAVPPLPVQIQRPVR